MNLEILYTLRERLKNILITGTSLLSEDFRLKKAVEEMALLAKVAPVFAQIDAMARALLQSERDAGERAMDLLALVNAVIETQADTAKVEELKEIESFVVPRVERNSYKMLEPVMTALTTRGSGRYEVLMNARKLTPEIFMDYRIFPKYIQGLGDSYSELATQINQWMKEDGKVMVAPLKRDFDPKGGTEMLSRLDVIADVAKGEENDFYLSIINAEASKNIRTRAIEALRYQKENKELLLEIAENGDKASKEAALKALSRSKGSTLERLWATLLKKSKVSVEILEEYPNEDWVSEIFANQLDEEHQRLEKAEKKEDRAKVLASINSIWKAAAGKTRKALVEKIESSLMMVEESTQQIYFMRGIMYFRTPELVEKIHQLFDGKEDAQAVQNLFLLSLMEDGCEKVFERFSPYLKEHNEDVLAPSMGIFHVLYRCFRFVHSDDSEKSRMREEILKKLDRRWYPLLLGFPWTKKQQSAVVYDPYLDGAGAIETLLKNIEDPKKDLGEYYIPFLMTRLKERVVVQRDIENLKRWGCTDFSGAFEGLKKALAKGVNWSNARQLVFALEAWKASKQEVSELLQEVKTIVEKQKKSSNVQDLLKLISYIEEGMEFEDAWKRVCSE